MLRPLDLRARQLLIAIDILLTATSAHPLPTPSHSPKMASNTQNVSLLSAGRPLSAARGSDPGVFSCQNSRSPQVVRYSALLAGLAYGFLHNRTVQKEGQEAAVRPCSPTNPVALLTPCL